MLFPKSSPPEKGLYVLDTHPMSDGYRYLSAVLQGLVNRNGPKIFRLCGAQCDIHNGDVLDCDNDYWLENMKSKGHEFADAPLSELLTRFRDDFDGAVLYDGNRPQYELNAVTMLCAQKNALPVTERMNRELKLPVVYDARFYWLDRFAAHDWIRENLWQGANDRILCSMPDHYTNLVDYVVAFKIFLLYYPNWPTERDDQNLRDCLMLTPPNTPVIGVWDLTYSKAPLQDDFDQERNFIDRLSKAGKFMTVTHEVSNLTVHSGMAGCKTKVDSGRLARDTTETGRNRFAFMYSEGDNISFLMCNMPLLWNDPQRSSIAITWSISPAMVELCPDILEHYLDQASDLDDFAVAMSGMGYMFPSLYGQWYEDGGKSALKGFLEQTSSCVESMAVGHVALLDHPDNDYIVPQGITGLYADSLAVLKGLYCDYPTTYGQLSQTADYVIDKRVCVFHAQSRGIRHVKELLELKDKMNQPVSLYVFVSGWGTPPTKLKKIAMELASDFDTVTATELCEKYLHHTANDSALFARMPHLLSKKSD